MTDHADDADVGVAENSPDASSKVAILNHNIVVQQHECLDVLEGVGLANQFVVCSEYRVSPSYGQNLILWAQNSLD